MLAHNYNPDQHDPSGWYMSEKLDGVRCVWDGKQLYTRNGNSIFAPEWWIKEMPDIALDGELWSKRDDFQKIVSIVRKQKANSEDWKQIKYMIFDGPTIKGKFKHRINVLKSKIEEKGSSIVQLVEQIVCKKKEDLVKLTDQICAEKGEGVMLKNPNSVYEGCRSFNLLKVKKFDDAEATVIGHERGTGRCENMCGAIIVREKSGMEFKIGSGFTDVQRRNPPMKGTVVTFKF